MIEESYCSLELCEKVKKLKIEDLECRSYYLDKLSDGKWRLIHLKEDGLMLQQKEYYYEQDVIVACPTHQTLKNWFRKRHGIYIVDNEPVDYNHWYCTILWTDNEGVLQREELTPTDDYDKAVDFALIRALTKITNDGKTEKTQG